LITHRHHDHADDSLAKRLVEMGKPVVGPAQLAQQWPDLAHGLTVPSYDQVQRIGPCSILTHFGYQYAASREDEDGQRVGEHVAGHPERSSETVRYLIQIGGTTFLQSAESHTEAHQWLSDANDQGWQVDVLLSPGQYQGARSVMKFLQKHEYLRIPVHEYELMHYGGGNRTGQLLDGSGRASFDRHRSMPLLWGEDFWVRKQ
jgi:L-ascorbate metabolism protein UlaG (beta-lactamase superfamily)